MTDPAREGRIWAVVPFRGPVGSKRRLAGLLDAAERERLSLAMLEDVLDVLLGADRVERVLLLTPSRARVEVAAHERLTIVEEPRGADGADQVASGAAEPRGLNAAVRHAQQVARASDADSLLIVPADVPLVGPADLEAILQAGVGASVVIAPDRAAEGTNGLLLTPPTILAPAFGEASYARHRRLAAEAGVRLGVVERPGLALDLDTPADVAELLIGRQAGRAAALLRELQVERRLERLETAQARSTTI